MRFSKRLFDLVLTIPGLLILLPVFVVIGLAIKAEDGGPVFFRQHRVGRGGHMFRIWKFRTMLPHAERRGALLTVGSDPRITRTGRWLRRLKLDELPQLLNVLTGEMSLVGPRPEVPQYVDLYTPDQRRVLELTPGITDPASILYRNEAEVLATAVDPHEIYICEVMPTKIAINLEYGARATLWTDLLVILHTIRSVGVDEAKAAFLGSTPWGRALGTRRRSR